MTDSSYSPYDPDTIDLQDFLKLRGMVELRQHNLLEPSGHLGQFDVIFCRNVLIYFDVPTKARVLDGLAPRLLPQGALLLGAAETVIGISTSIVPDRQHRGVYRSQHSVHAQPAGLGLPLEPIRAAAGLRH